MPSLLCPLILLFRVKVWKKFKLDLVNDLVRSNRGSVCKRKRWQNTFRDIIKAKRLNPNKAIDNRAAFGLVLVLAP